MQLLCSVSCFFGGGERIDSYHGYLLGFPEQSSSWKSDTEQEEICDEAVDQPQQSLTLAEPLSWPVRRPRFERCASLSLALSVSRASNVLVCLRDSLRD